jgi:YggT family protein
MVLSLLTLIVGTLCDFLSLAFLARLVMQWTRAPFRNPVGQFVMAVTDWAVKPVRRVVPGLFGLDLASLLLAWLVQSGYLGLIFGIVGFAGGAFGNLGAVALGGIVDTLRLSVQLASAVVIVSALLSWINPYAPLAPVFNHLSGPLLRPVQRRLPPVGGVDLSPLVVLLALQALLMVLGYWRAAILPIFVR